MTHEEFCRVWIPLGEGLLVTATGILGSHSDAEDALQDLYIRLWQQRDTLDNVYNPAGYATRVLKNICIDRLRASKPTEQLPDDLQGYDDTDVRIENAEKIKLTASAIIGLPLTQRRILEMRVMEGLSYEEISKRTGMSGLSLRVLLSRARATIRKRI